MRKLEMENANKDEEANKNVQGAVQLVTENQLLNAKLDHLILIVEKLTKTE